jgi:hypothetical protein
VVVSATALRAKVFDLSELMKNVLAMLIAAIVAAYPVQKLAADAWNAPTMVIWAAWLGLTVCLFLLLRRVLANRPGRRSD